MEEATTGQLLDEMAQKQIKEDHMDVVRQKNTKSISSSMMDISEQLAMIRGELTNLTRQYAQTVQRLDTIESKIELAQRIGATS